MTFAEFSSAVRLAVFPEGEPENLVTHHKNWIVDALVDLQRKIKCLQEKHFDCFPMESTLRNCSATLFDAPRGFIQGLRTMSTADSCQRGLFEPLSQQDFECRMQDERLCGSPNIPSQDYLTGTYPELTYGNMYPNADTDAACHPTNGIFTLINGQIWMLPHLNSTEIAVLEWDGIKREWDDADPVEFDREITKLVELFLEAESKRKEDCDRETFITAITKYNAGVGDQIYQCNKERRLPERKPCFSNCGFPSMGCGSSSTVAPTPFACY